MPPSNPDGIYLLRLYWDNYLLMRAVILGAGGYAFWTFAIVVVEFARESAKQAVPRAVSHQLLACWATCFLWVAGLLATCRVLETLPLQ